MGLREVRFAKGDRVRLSNKAKEGNIYPLGNHDNREATVISHKREIVWIMWDGNITHTTVHQSFIEPSGEVPRRCDDVPPESAVKPEENDQEDE